MHRRLPFRAALAVAALIVPLLACNLPASANPGTRATEAALTVQAIVNESATRAPTQAPTITPVVIFTNTPAPVAVPSETPTPGPTPGAACTNDSLFVEDVTVPDNTSFAANAGFTKTWRLRNTGTCTWDSMYQFKFIEGDPMGAPPSVPVEGSVPPGETVDLSVDFVAPAAAGTYRSRWRLFAPDGTPFGQQPYVQIVVP